MNNNRIKNNNKSSEFFEHSNNRIKSIKINRLGYNLNFFDIKKAREFFGKNQDEKKNSSTFSTNFFVKRNSKYSLNSEKSYFSDKRLNYYSNKNSLSNNKKNNKNLILKKKKENNKDKLKLINNEISTPLTISNIQSKRFFNGKN